MRLTGNRCRCSACGEYFNSVWTFDGHRVGNWQDRGANRRCLSVSEMQARGWLRNDAGFWISGKRPMSAMRAPHGAGDGSVPATPLQAPSGSPAGMPVLSHPPTSEAMP